MNDPVTEGLTQTRLAASQEAASTFVSLLPVTDRVAVVSYSTSAHLAQPLTTARSAVTETIHSLTADGGTNIGDGINLSHQELITSPRHLPGTVKTIILLSDGKANSPIDEETAKAYAREQAESAAGDSIRIYAIGFGSDADEDLLQDIADISGGKYFFAPDGDVPETIYLTLALELHILVITDILTPGVQTECSQWPSGWCTVSSSGVTTLTVPITDSLLISDPTTFCFAATVNLDPGYEGPINLPGSGVCYQDAEGQPACQEFNNPPVAVGGRKITGWVFYDVNANGFRDIGEAGVPSVIVQASTGLTTLTSSDGGYVLRTSSEPAISVTIEVPSGYATTTQVPQVIPAVTGIYSTGFGIRTAVYLPIVSREYPLPTIINGGFEDGWTGWTHGGGLAQTIASTNPFTRAASLPLGGFPLCIQGGVPIGSAWMEQTFYVPHTNDPRLSFWYNIFTQDLTPGLSDTFDVMINRVLKFRDAKEYGSYGCTPQVERIWFGGPGQLTSAATVANTSQFASRTGIALTDGITPGLLWIKCGSCLKQCAPSARAGTEFFGLREKLFARCQFVL